MSSELEEYFTITWRVKNYSMCPVALGDFIKSPVVLVRELGNSEWSLQLYPNGLKKDGFVSCYLKCENLGVYETVHVETQLSVVTELPDKKLQTSEDNFKLNKDWGFSEWIPIEDILNKRDEYLPKDTLTIKFSMKSKNPSDSKNVDMEIIKALSRNFISEQNSLNTNKCCCETTIRVQTKRFLWPIPRFLSLSKNERITLPVFSSLKETPSFNVTLYKSAESFINIEIRRKDNESNTFVRCTFSAINTPKDVNYCLEDEFLFKSKGDVWTISRFVDCNVLEKDGYFQMNEGVLYLQFDFAFSIYGDWHHIEKHDWDSPFPPTKSLVPLEFLEQSVVKLKAMHRTFIVHRALLKAESEVFDAMFKSDMKEKETGVVDIPDVEPETLGRMLSFLYSGTVGDRSTTNLYVINLYAAAHKYQVLSLMDYCSSVIKSSLTVFNVSDILHFADLYGDDRLLKTAEDFIIGNSDCVIISQGWKNLMEKNVSLAANIMYKMLLK